MLKEETAPDSSVGVSSTDASDSTTSSVLNSNVLSSEGSSSTIPSSTGASTSGSSSVTSSVTSSTAFSSTSSSALTCGKVLWLTKIPAVIATDTTPTFNFFNPNLWIFWPLFSNNSFLLRWLTIHFPPVSLNEIVFCKRFTKLYIIMTTNTIYLFQETYFNRILYS